MKIALALHGLFDSTTDLTSKGISGYNHIKKHILDNNNVDVFIHSWETEKQEQICNLYNPVNSIFESPQDFPIIKDRNLESIKGPRPIYNVLSHFYSVSESMKLVYNYQTKYDIVIKSRFDLGQINRNSSKEFPVQCINFITNIENNKLYTAYWERFAMGPADMWFYGDYEIMKNFQTLYDELKKNMFIDSEFHMFAKSIENNIGDLANSIAFYKYWMIKNGLWNNLIKLKTLWE